MVFVSVFPSNGKSYSGARGTTTVSGVWGPGALVAVMAPVSEPRVCAYSPGSWSGTHCLIVIITGLGGVVQSSAGQDGRLHQCLVLGFQGSGAEIARALGMGRSNRGLGERSGVRSRVWGGSSGPKDGEALWYLDAWEQRAVAVGSIGQISA